jgi:uncharacterized protein (TIRG00374 family)
MKKKITLLAVITVVILVFMYYFFRDVDWKEVLKYLSTINIPVFILFVLFIPSHFVTRAVRWHYLLKHENHNTGLYNRFAAIVVGYTVSIIFPGRLGEIARPLYLAKKEKMKKGFVIGTVVIERIFDVFVMCVLLGLFMLSKPLYASIFHINEESFQRLQFWGIIGLGGASTLLLIALSLYFFRIKTIKAFSFLLKPFPNKISDKVLKLTEEFIQGLKFFHSTKDFLMYTLWSFIVWLGIIFLYQIFFLAYNIKINYFFIFPYIFLILVGASIPTPGMIGGFHAFSKLGLTSFYGIDPNLAVSMTIVVHAVQIMVTCLLGYAILSKEGISFLQAKKLGEVNKS